MYGMGITPWQKNSRSCTATADYKELTVKQAAEGGLRDSLVARRSTAATAQLAQALQIMEQQRLGEGRDRRQSPLFKRNGDLDTSMLYKTLKTPDSSPDPWA